MATRRAGVITIDLVGRSTKLQSESRAGAAELGKLGVAAQNTGRAIGQGMSVGADGVRRVGVEAGKATLSVAGYGSALLHVVEATSALVASHALAAAAMAKYAAGSAASVSTTNELVNGYRLLRIVLSPTVFTAASLAAGVLVEETIRLVNARAKLIDQQAAFAASNRLSFQSVDSLDAVSKVSGSNPDNIRSLFSGLRSEFAGNQKSVESALKDLGVSGAVGDPLILGRIAAGFQTISDPARQAELAVKLFGDQAGLALKELDRDFASGSDAVGQYGIAIDQLSRTQIHQFRQDLLDLRHALTDFSAEKAWWESFKTGTEIVAAAAEDMSKRGVSALEEMIHRYVPGLNILGSALTVLAPGLQGLAGPLVAPAKAPANFGFGTTLVPGATGSKDQTIATQDILAEIEGAKARHAANTIEGQRTVAEEATRRSREALDKIKADDAAREKFRTVRQFNPTAQEPQGLLTTDQRFALSLEARSSSDLAKVTNDHVKVMESAKEIAALLRDRFTSINTDLTATAKKVKELSIPAGPARDRARIEDTATRSVESFRRQAQGTLRDEAGNPIGGISDATASKIRALEITKEEKKAEEEWQSSLTASLEAIQQRIRVQTLLNSVIGKTVVETRAAAIEGKLIERFGPEYDNPALQGDIGKARAAFTAEDTAKRSGEIKKQSDELRTEVALELELASAQLKGATAVDEVRRAEVERKLQASGLSELVDLELDLMDARKLNADNTEAKADLDAQQQAIDKLDLEIEGEEALAKAQVHGAEAVRKQSLENKLALLDYDSASTKVFDTLSQRTKTLDELKNQSRITEEALATGRAYTDRLRTLGQELAVIKALEHDQGATRDLELDRKRIEEDIQQALARQALAVGTLTDGYKAFFTTIGQEAEKPGQILYDGMHSAVEQTSDELSKLLTGQKTSWGKAFQDIGRQFLKGQLESTIKQGLGAIGDRFPGLKLPGSGNAVKRPTLASGDPGHVIVDNLGTIQASPGTLAPKLPGAVPPPVAPRFGGGGGLFGSGNVAPFIFSLLSKKREDGSADQWSQHFGESQPGNRTRPGPTGYPSDPIYVSQGGFQQGEGNGLNFGGAAQKFGDIGSVVSSVGSAGSIGLKTPVKGYALGTDATPVGSAYWVGERGPELEINSQPHSVVPLDKLGMGDGEVHYHTHIDARGSELGVENRIDAKLKQFHAAAVSNSVRANAELGKRTPQRSR